MSSYSYSFCIRFYAQYLISPREQKHSFLNFLRSCNGVSPYIINTKDKNIGEEKKSALEYVDFIRKRNNSQKKRKFYD